MLWLLAGLAGCKSEVQYPATFATGNLALDVVIAGAPAASRIEQVRVSIEGPTSRVLTVTPGSTQTIDGLAPGSYTVVLEGLTGGEVETFGERAGVNVTAGSNTTVTLTMNSFVPVLTGLSAQVTVDQNVVVQFNPVTGASSYMVEWATEAAFTNPQSTTTSSTTASIRASAAGSLFVRVRARNRLGSNGRPASGGPVTVTPPAGLQLGITVAGNGSGTVTSAPAGINCTLTSGASGGTCATTFALGTVVTLTAAPATGNTFGGWQNACTGTVLTCQVTLDQARQVTVTFSAPTAQQLSVSGSGNGSGTVVSSPAGINCALTATTGTGTCATTFPFGSSVTLTASAATGHTFSGWAGACSGSATCQVTLDQARLVTAIFSAPGPQTLTVIGAGSGSGTVTSVPASLNCAINAGVASGSCTNSFAFNSTVTLTATPAANHGFTGWSGACTGSAPTCQVTLNQTRFVTATFSGPSQILTIRSAGSGAGTVTSAPAGINCNLNAGSAFGDCMSLFAFNSVVTLTAAAATNNTFNGWSGACSGTALTCQVTLDQARQVTATFTGPPQQLNVNGGGTGSGTVVSSPAGINCTITLGVRSGTCLAPFPLLATITLTATPASGHTFGSFSFAGCGSSTTCQVLLDQNQSLTATFNAPGPQQLTLLSGGSGAGTVTSAPAGINCSLNSGFTSGTCSNSFAFNTVVTLTAAAPSGNSFGGWSGACTGTALTCQVTMSQARQVTATFIGPPQQLNINPSGNGSGVVTSSPTGINCTITLGVRSGSCLATFPLEGTITLTVSPASGHTFNGWNTACTSQTATTCVLILDQNRNVTVAFTAPSSPDIDGITSGGGAYTAGASVLGSSLPVAAMRVRRTSQSPWTDSDDHLGVETRGQMAAALRPDCPASSIDRNAQAQLRFIPAESAFLPEALFRDRPRAILPANC